MEATENKEIDLEENENITEADVAEEEAAENQQGSEENSAAADKSEEDNTKEEAAEEESEEAQNSKKGLFKKKEKKNKQEEKIAELTDRVQRQMAEFDNFRKRTEKEKSAMYEVGARDIIEKILPVLDNFERGLAAVPEDLKGGSFAEGVEMIYKQFIKTLEDAGVEAIEAVGQQFNPDLHNAVMHIDDEAYGENEISQELQKGYKYRGTVVRHSMVQVAN